MKESRRPGRRWLAGWLVLALLFAQLASAAHACPHGLGDASAALRPCHGAHAAPDVEQPQLCKAHCEQGSQSFSPALTHDLSGVPVLLAVLDWTPRAPAAMRALPFALPAGAPPPGAPPIYIALQVLRN